MDPWKSELEGGYTPETFSPCSSSSSRNTNIPCLSSDQYLWSLEAKLARVKDRNGKEPRARDIISGLDSIRQSYLLSDSQATENNLPYISNSDYIEDYRTTSIVNMLQRKIAPEKQALNSGELRVLVKNDELESSVVTTEMKVDLESEQIEETVVVATQDAKS